jgi:CHAT domain-containing protein/tetratricopeptide (TPR) repeat protein
MTEKRQNVRSRSFLLRYKSDILPVASFYGNERVHLLPHAANSRRLVLFVFALGLLLAGRSSTPTRNGAIIPADSSSDELMRKGSAQFRAGSLQAAAELFEQGFRNAVRLKDWDRAIQFQSNLASSRFALFQYRKALEAYLEAKRLAENHFTHYKGFGVICSNLSALYLELGNLPAAAQVAEQGLVSAAHRGPAQFRPMLLAQLGTLRARQKRLSEAEACFREAVGSAEVQGNQAAIATAWDHLGQELLQAEKPDEAEHSLLEGFRIRKLTHDRKLSQSYFHLSRLRLAQGDVQSAANLLDRVVTLPGNPDLPPLWMLYRQRAGIKMAEGHPAEAVNLLRVALEAAEDWRADATAADPAETLPNSSSGVLHQLYQEFIDASVQLPKPLVVEAFAAAEKDRAASLRRVLMSAPGWRLNMPPKYWDTLARLRTAHTVLIARDTPDGRATVNRLRYDLLELESLSGLPLSPTGNKSGEKYSPGNTLNTIRQGLGPDEAFLSVSLGDSSSHLWVVTRDGLKWSSLRPRKTLCALADRFRQAVEGGSADRDRLGEELYQALFGGLSAGVRQKSKWLLAADDALFAVPFAALVVERSQDRPVYFVERHTHVRVPSAMFLAADRDSATDGGFLGVGDGVYNTADPRWRARRSSGSGGPLQLPRLPGSRDELTSCARQWRAGGHSVLLTGPEVSRNSFQAALANRPSVIHIAAHVLRSPDDPGEALIGLGLSRAGEMDVLTREDIATLRVPGSIVIMSGCASGAARAAPSSGVLGLMRAWMIAGAEAVVGSHWAIGDDSGELFADFYRYFGGLRDAGNKERIACQALRQAQLDALRSNTWRSDPRYWSAFFTVGKN